MRLENQRYEERFLREPPENTMFEGMDIGEARARGLAPQDPSRGLQTKIKTVLQTGVISDSQGYRKHQK